MEELKTEAVKTKTQQPLLPAAFNTISHCIIPNSVKLNLFTNHCTNEKQEEKNETRINLACARRST